MEAIKKTYCKPVNGGTSCRQEIAGYRFDDGTLLDLDEMEAYVDHDITGGCESCKYGQALAVCHDCFNCSDTLDGWEPYEIDEVMEDV